MRNTKVPIPAAYCYLKGNLVVVLNSLALVLAKSPKNTTSPKMGIGMDLS
jgi:hypothetical protein